MIFNRNIYTIQKNNVARFLNMINRFHINPDINVTIDKKTVTISVSSSANMDFYYMLPLVDKKTYMIDDQQKSICDIINNLSYTRLSKGNDNTYIKRKYKPIDFNRLVELTYMLKYVKRLFINPYDNIIYIGIGSEKLGYFIIDIKTDGVSDASCPSFNINKGFSDPFQDRSLLLDSITSISTNSHNRFSNLNLYFTKWLQDTNNTILFNVDQNVVLNTV